MGRWPRGSNPPHRAVRAREAAAGRPGCRTLATPLLALLLACGPVAERSPSAPDPATDWDAARVAEAGRLEAALSSRAGADAHSLVVRLAFAAAVDLDLYVTDPWLETLYYANTPVRSGGRLLNDRRCDDGGPPGIRIEEVRFERPPSGTYRIGVDYPHRCRADLEGAVPFALRVDAGGARTLTRGLAGYQIFQPIVERVDVE